MEIYFKEDDQYLSYIISDFPVEYKGIFESQYYSFEERQYVKKFPKPIANIDIIKANFSKNVEELIQQAGYFKPVLWEEALLGFAEKVKNTDIDWWLTGSCALCLRGISVMPHDVDIMLNSKDINKINEIFIDSIVQPIISTNGWVVKHFGVLFLHGQIDLAFDPEEFIDQPEPVDFGRYALNNLEEVVWRGHVVKIPPLELQLLVNQRRGRNDRVQAIEEHLRRKV